MDVWNMNKTNAINLGVRVSLKFINDAFGDRISDVLNAL